MARQAGDNRAFTSPYGRVLLYARLVLEAMCNDTTEAGKRFAKEREDLYLRWHRLIRTIIADHGGDSPFPSIESVDEVLDDPRSVLRGDGAAPDRHLHEPEEVLVIGGAEAEALE